jgi:phosphate transport system permease protein
MGKTVDISMLASANIDSAFKGIDLSVPEARRKVKDQQITWMNELAKDGTLAEKFNTGLFTYGASSRPETSGIGVAIIGSLYMMAIVLVLALLIGVAASIYLGGIRGKEPAD